MSEKRCCGTCKYGRYDRDYGYLCLNSDSDNYADFTEHDYCCEEWEEKE